MQRSYKIEHGKKTNKNRAVSLASPICAIQQCCDDKCRVAQMSVCLAVFWMTQKSQISGNFTLRSSLQNPDDKRTTAISSMWAAVIPQTKKTYTWKAENKGKEVQAVRGISMLSVSQIAKGKGIAKNDFYRRYGWYQLVMAQRWWHVRSVCEELRKKDKMKDWEKYKKKLHWRRNLASTVFIWHTQTDTFNLQFQDNFIK